MTEILFADVRVIDGTGNPPFAGSVVVKGNRISRIERDGELPVAPGARVVDGAGLALMPGLTDAHAHLSFLNAAGLQELTALPAERQVLATANNARLLPDHGYTSMFGGAAVRPRIDVANRDAITAGAIPGPRLLAAPRAVTVARGLGNP